jgi:hypothetical protein
VIKVGEQLQAIDSAADPDGLVTSVRAELAAEYRAANSPPIITLAYV